MNALKFQIVFFIIVLLFFNSCKEEIVDSLPIEIQSQVTHVSEYNGSDGAIDVYVSGGTGPYTYLWSTGQTTQDIDSLIAGLYSLCVTDMQGETQKDTFEVSQPSPDSLIFSKAVTHVSAFGLNDGKIDVKVTGGVTPYTFLWSNGDTSEDISSLVAGTYNVTVTDAIGTTITDTTIISQPDPEPMSLTLSGDDISEYGKNDGAVTAIVTGGVQPYSYEWSNGETTPRIENLEPGTYQLIVTDCLGSLLNESITISEPAPDAIIFSIETIINPSETGASDGEIQTTVSGGYPPYNFSWSNGGNSQNITGLPAGTYSVTVSDIIGQTKTEATVLTDSVYDYDGNAYSFIKIGEQVWMQQNLNVTHAPDGNTITCFAYNNNESNAKIYGRLYTWDVAMNGSTEEMAMGICPAGWHIPGDEEFKILEMELGMTREEADMENTWRGREVGTKLKAEGSSGYNALMSGRLNANGSFRYLGSFEYVWTSTVFENDYAWRRCLDLYDDTVGRWNTFPITYGFSVRCIKDE